MWDDGLDELLAGQELPKDVWAEKVNKVITDIQMNDTPVLAVVERLDNYLSNDNDAPRTRSTALLAQVRNVHTSLHHTTNSTNPPPPSPQLPTHTNTHRSYNPLLPLLNQMQTSIIWHNSSLLASQTGQPLAELSQAASPLSTSPLPSPSPPLTPSPCSALSVLSFLSDLWQ